MAKFGKPRYGGDFGKEYKPVEGDNHIRILPPMHSLAEDGTWHVYHGIHYGYHGVDSQDATKTRNRPFRCVGEKAYKGMAAVECPACIANDKVEEQKKEKEAQLIAAGADKDVIETQLAPFATWLKDHNVDRKQYLNVMRPEGDVGFFKISHKTYKQLDSKLTELRENNDIDAIDAEAGCWINIKRTGKMLASVDTVEAVMENVKVDGKTYQSFKLAPLTDEQADKALSECKDLALVGTRLTAEQIQALVDCGGDPEAVDKIFGGAVVVAAKPAAPVSKPAAVAAPAPAVEKAPAAEQPKPIAAAVDPAIAARVKAIQDKKAAEAAKAAQAAQAAAEAAQPSVDPSTLSDEDFLTQFGGG